MKIKAFAASSLRPANASKSLSQTIPTRAVKMFQQIWLCSSKRLIGPRGGIRTFVVPRRDEHMSYSCLSFSTPVF